MYVLVQGVSTNIVKANPSKGKQIDMCFQLVCSRFSTFDFFGIQVGKKLWKKLLSNVSHTW
jgi:hypothetical protein